MAMSFVLFTLNIMICSLCVVTAQSAGSRDERNYPSTPLRSFTKDVPKTSGEKRNRSDQNEEIQTRGLSEGGSSVTRGKHILETVNKIESKREIVLKKRKAWGNEQYLKFLRLIYAHYNSDPDFKGERFDWRMITLNWNEPGERATRKLFREQLSRMKCSMQEVLKYHDGSIKWTDELTDDLLKVYFDTETKDKSVHADKMYDLWVRKYPEYHEMTPASLLTRVHLMLDSVLKFSLDNARGPPRSGQAVDWQPKHDDLLRSLWQKYPIEDLYQVQHIYNDAIGVYPGLKFLKRHRVFERARKLAMMQFEDRQKSALYGESVRDTTHGQYHVLMEQQSHPSMIREPHRNDEWIASTSSHQEPSHSHPDLELRLNTPNSGDKSPDTNLRLGW